MKKLIVIILVLTLTLGLFGCGGQTPEESTGAPKETEGSSEGFRVGYRRENIMPEGSVPLAGYGNNDRRMSTGALDYIQATCIAITDDADTTILLITMDLVQPKSQVVEPARELISTTTGIPQDHIMITATHTHSGPDLGSTNLNIKSYLSVLPQKLLKAAEKALEDRKPAQMFVGSAEAEGLNFVRHYLLSDGSYAGDNFGDWNAGEIVGHATEVDPTMHVVKFAREGGKDVVLINWRAHPIKTGGATKYDISADYIAPLRETLEEEMDCQVAYFQGASGNVNSTSRIGAESTDANYRKYGAQLAACAKEALEHLTQIETGRIQTEQIQFSATVNHTTDNLVAQAKEIQSIWSKTNDHNQVRKAGKPYGIRSPYHANAIVARASMGATDVLELNVLTIGNDLALVTVPDEMFDTNSVYLEENSPYTKTLFLGYANGANSYIPSELGFTYTCYESDICRYVQGTAEQIIDTFLTTLNRFHEAG